MNCLCRFSASRVADFAATRVHILKCGPISANYTVLASAEISRQNDICNSEDSRR